MLVCRRLKPRLRKRTESSRKEEMITRALPLCEEATRLSEKDDERVSFSSLACESMAEPFRLGYLCAEPLAYRKKDGSTGSIPQVQTHRKGELRMLRALASCSGGSVRWEAGTVRALRTLLTAGCDALHFTGHGLAEGLAFEAEGKAELEIVDDARLASLAGAVPLVFCSACRSERAGRAFAGAGARHVVCTPRDAKVTDADCRDFAWHLYAAVLAGRTVQQAFDIAQATVGARFLLLPENTTHDETLVACGPSRCCAQTDDEDDVVNDCPAPPERVFGRASSAAAIVRLLDHESRRVVTVAGPLGVGKSAVARAAVEYMADRRVFAAVAHASLRDIDVSGGIADACSAICGRLVDAAFHALDAVGDLPECVASTPSGVAAAFDKLARAAVARCRARAPPLSRPPDRILLVLDDVAHEPVLVPILSFVLDRARAVSLLCTAVSPLHAGPARLESEPEKVVTLEPLDEHDMARLVVDLAPRSLVPNDFPVLLKPALLRVSTSDELFQKRNERALAVVAAQPFVAALRGLPRAAAIFAPQLLEPDLTDPAAGRRLADVAARAAAAAANPLRPGVVFGFAPSDHQPDDDDEPSSWLFPSSSNDEAKKPDAPKDVVEMTALQAPTAKSYTASLLWEDAASWLSATALASALDSLPPWPTSTTTST